MPTSLLPILPVSDRNTREAMSYFGLKHIPNCVARTHHNWVSDKSLLKPLETKRNQTSLILLLFIYLNVCKAEKVAQNQTQLTGHTTINK